MPNIFAYFELQGGECGEVLVTNILKPVFLGKINRNARHQKSTTFFTLKNPNPITKTSGTAFAQKMWDSGLRGRLQNLMIRRSRML